MAVQCRQPHPVLLALPLNKGHLCTAGHFSPATLVQPVPLPAMAKGSMGGRGGRGAKCRPSTGPGHHPVNLQNFTHKNLSPTETSSNNHSPVVLRAMVTGDSL